MKNSRAEIREVLENLRKDIVCLGAQLEIMSGKTHGMNALKIIEEMMEEEDKKSKISLGK